MAVKLRLMELAKIENQIAKYKNHDFLLSSKNRAKKRLPDWLL